MIILVCRHHSPSKVAPNLKDLRTDNIRWTDVQLLEAAKLTQMLERLRVCMANPLFMISRSLF